MAHAMGGTSAGLTKILMSRTRRGLFTIARVEARIAVPTPRKDLKSCNNMSKNRMIGDYAESCVSANLE